MFLLPYVNILLFYNIYHMSTEVNISRYFTSNVVLRNITFQGIHGQSKRILQFIFLSNLFPGVGEISFHDSLYHVRHCELHIFQLDVERGRVSG